ncbi:MAG TPA: hypothetical protein VIF09_02630 [Polyangiaceae bacterium]|jgi:hypothetical protein
MLRLAGVLLVLSLVAACGGASAPPRDRCAATMTSLQALEPMCWVDAGGPAGNGDAAVGR